MSIAQKVEGNASGQWNEATRQQRKAALLASSRSGRAFPGCDVDVTEDVVVRQAVSASCGLQLLAPARHDDGQTTRVLAVDAYACLQHHYGQATVVPSRRRTIDPARQG
ncbi:hypothetical protein Aave_2690 [Paracidovorax citrulli AAC00-1]|uniref:Uncharacterized protein n=1 Tax=Paracidovorax citrulli (strain AAC00-1) TaxID=397945 RepID=A1TQM4_PARC0|nr:hypothetical protein Aave_2690 [Paracidovorax citrulli AAC00-1]